MDSSERKKLTDLSYSYLSEAGSSIKDMVSAGQSAVASTGLGVGAMQDALKTAKEGAATIHKNAGAMNALADETLPIAGKLAGDAATIRDIGASSLANSQAWLKQSKGLLDLDESVGGISGDWTKLYKQLDPNLQVALAAGDARAEVQAQSDAAVRALQRAGVSPTSSSIASVTKHLAEASSALVAAAKTKAKQSGVTFQMEALEQGLNMAMAQAGMGEKFAQDAVTGTATAASVEQMGAAVKQGVASIYGASANLVANAQQILQAAASGVISASSNQIAAYNALIQSFSTAAEYYSVQASSFRGLAE